MRWIRSNKANTKQEEEFLSFLNNLMTNIQTNNFRHPSQRRIQTFILSSSSIHVKINRKTVLFHTSSRIFFRKCILPFLPDVLLFLITTFTSILLRSSPAFLIHTFVNVQPMLIIHLASQNRNFSFISNEGQHFSYS